MMFYFRDILSSNLYDIRVLNQQFIHTTTSLNETFSEKLIQSTVTLTRHL